MDPNAALAQLRELVDKYNDSYSNDWDSEDMSLVIDLIDDLDGWLSRRGVLPDDWQTTGARYKGVSK